MNVRGLWVAACLAVSPATARAEGWSALSGGRHVRFETERGAVHVFRPAEYARATAGLVVYVHGYFTDVDGAFTGHRLAEQFAESRQNALFIVPEAPQNKQDDVRFPDLGALLDLVETRAHVTRPDGPLVVVGHSGAYRTIAAWLSFRRIDQIILVDALYGDPAVFRAFTETAPGHAAKKLVLVSVETREKTETMLAPMPLARTASAPARLGELGRGLRRAQVLHLESELDHMALVTSGTLLPVLLRLTPLRRW